MGLKVFTTPSIPLTGDRNPSRKGKDVTALQGFFSKIIPSFFVDKASCTRQFESELSLHSLASLFHIKEGIFSNPSVSLSKGSSTSNQAFLLRRKDVNRPTRCSEPLRSKVGGPSKVFAILCGMGPPGEKNKYLERQVIVERLK